MIADTCPTARIQKPTGLSSRRNRLNDLEGEPVMRFSMLNSPVLIAFTSTQRSTEEAPTTRISVRFTRDVYYRAEVFIPVAYGKRSRYVFHPRTSSLTTTLATRCAASTAGKYAT